MEISNIVPEQVIQNITSYIPNLVLATVVLLVGFKLQSYINKWLTKFFDEQDYDESLEKFIQSLLITSYKIGIILLSISIAGIQTTSIVAAIGAAGFAVGLALQGSMSNFASGILILTLKPIKVGEFVEIKNYTGTVNKIDIFNTVILTVDNKTVIIPNSDITSNILTNYSRQKTRRVDLEIGVSYDSNMKEVKDVILKTIKGQKDLVINEKGKEPFVRIENLADSAIVYSVRVWCNSKDYLTVKYNLLEDIKENLDKANIEIPYQTITIKKD